MFQLDINRLSQLENIINAFAKEGFSEMRNTIGGASFAVTALLGHLIFHDENLKPEEQVAIQAVVFLLEKLK